MYTSTQRGTSGISSGSIDALRVQLMKMNAQQLQAFAQANQDDAIKLGLAAEADKYKKQHAQEAMALMSGQQQKPPIAQQILQSIGQPPQQQQPQGPQQGQGPMPPQGQGGPMPPQGMPPQGMPPQQMAQGPMPPQGMADGGYVLPEDQGIATLPVGGMDFAEGGIVGYADGGGVPGYADGTLVGQGFRRDQMLPPPTSSRNAAIASTMANISAQASQDELAKIEAQLQSMPPSPQRDYLENRKRLLLNSSAPPVAPKEAIAPAIPYDPATATRRSMYSEKAAPPPDVKNLQKGSAIPQQGGITSLATTPEAIQTAWNSMQQPAADQFEGRIRNIGEMEQANAAAALAQRRQDIEDLGPAYTEREAKLKDRQGRIEKEEGKLPYMAMLEAGLAMMGGTSPHAFVNIGAGGATGLKSYKQGVDKISEAKDKLDDAFGRIEEARRGEKVLNAKELRELENNVRKTVTQTEKDVLAGAQQAYGLSQQQTKSMFDAYVKNQATMFEQEQQNKRTAMTVNAPTQLERILRDPVLSERYADVQLGPANLRREIALRTQYYDNPSLVKQYPTVEAYLLANGVGGQGGINDGSKVLGSRPGPQP